MISEYYSYNPKNDLYLLKSNIDQSDEDYLLKLFIDSSELNIPLKVLSSKYSDKFFQPKIVGIFDFDYTPIDQNYIIVPFNRLQRLVNLNNQTQTIIILLDKINKLKDTKNDIIKLLNNPDFSVKDWEEFPLMAMFKQMNYIYYIIYAVFIIMASFVIINTVIMVIHERIKEIGMMGALGLDRKEIVLVFFLEAAILSFFGSFFGTLIGGIGTFIGSLFPINFEAITGGIDFKTSNTIFLSFSWAILSFSFLFGLILTSFCTIIPSLKSAFIEPVEALRR